MTVVDSASGAPAASGATITAIHESDAVTDSVTVPNDPTKDGISPTLGAESGNYKVLVTKAGYEPWSKSNIAVAQAVCRLQTVSVKALLQRL